LHLEKSAPRLAAQRARNRNPSAERYCVPLWLGAGINGRGDIAPESVVAGGLAGWDVLPVTAGGGPLLALLPLPCPPAMIRNAMSSNTATPAIQLQVPPMPSSRRSTGSLNRGSV
jgi:hypothetical protein